jgi:hypothetical protein
VKLVKPFYLSSETVLPIKSFYLSSTQLVPLHQGAKDAVVVKAPSIPSNLKSSARSAAARGRIGATNAMSAPHVRQALVSWASLSKAWHLDDAHVSAMAALNGEISRLAAEFTEYDAINVLGRIATSGIRLSSVLAQSEWESMMTRVGELEHQLTP